MKPSRGLKKRLYQASATAREYASLADAPAVRESFEHVADQFDRAAAGVDASPDKATLVHTGGHK
jgi:hypothetical protein